MLGFAADFDTQPRAGHAILLHELHSGDMVTIRHSITYERGVPSYGPGHAVTQQDVHELMQLLDDPDHNSQGLTLQPVNVLAQSPAALAWYRPPAVRRLWFKGASDKPVAIDAPWPGMVFRANKQGKLHVAALKTRSRPCANTPLFHAPLMNIYRSGLLCNGSATPPTHAGIDTIAAWEAMIDDSFFTHVNHDQTLTLAGSERVDTAAHLRFWRALGKHKTAKTFPAKSLRPMKLSLKNWLEAE